VHTPVHGGKHDAKHRKTGTDKEVRIVATRVPEGVEEEAI
jgi:hypothetical protein